MNRNANASPSIRVVMLKNGLNAAVKENEIQEVRTLARKDQESNFVVLESDTSTRGMAVSNENTTCNRVSSQTRGDINIQKCIQHSEVGKVKLNLGAENGDNAENNPGNTDSESNKCETGYTYTKMVIDQKPQLMDPRNNSDDSFVCKIEASLIGNDEISANICEANVRKEHYINDVKTHIKQKVEIGHCWNEASDDAQQLKLTSSSIAATTYAKGNSDDSKHEIYYNKAILTNGDYGNTKTGITPYENRPTVFTCLGSRPVYPHKDMLEQMKKTLSVSFLQQVMQQRKQAEEQKMAQLLPGTDVEYRTPGANFRNKNGRVKRPMNAFMVWAREYRGRLAAAMPRATNSEISVTLGRVWASLPTHEKNAYYDIAENIKRKHRQDFPNWVYKPSFQRREEIPVPRLENPWARVIVDPTGSNKTITVTSQAAPATTTSIPNTFIPSDTPEQVSVVKSGLQIGNHQHGTLDNMVKSVTHVERIPVILQRVTLQTNAESSASTPHVSSYTKGLLANKIACSNHGATQPSTAGITAHAHGSAVMPCRPEMTVVPQRQDVYLTPSLQKSLAMMSAMSSSIRPTHTQNIPSQLKFGDQKLQISNIGVRPGSLTTVGPPHRHLQSMQKTVPAPIIPIYQSHISPVVKAPAFGPTTTLKSADIKLNLSVNEPAVTSSVGGNANFQSRRSDETVLKTTNEDNFESLIREARACLNEKYNSGVRKVSPRINVPTYCFKAQTLVSPEESDQKPEVDAADDCWPFPFSENPDDWALTTRAREDIYLEMRDPYDPFLVADDDVADRFPGGLHLDVDSWNRYLESDEDADDSLVMLQPSKKAPDISISPLPLKETLRRYLNAVVESSESGDVITGDLMLEVVT